MRQLHGIALLVGVDVQSLPLHLDAIAMRALPSSPEYRTRLREATLAGKYFAKQRNYKASRVREVIEYREELELERQLTDLKCAQELLQARGWGYIIPERLTKLTTSELRSIIQNGDTKRVRPETSSSN